MSAAQDMSQYLDLFLQEAGEQLEILEAETLKLEQDPSIERLQVIFRAAHTLKGSSRAMGFENMAELTHEMENVLDQLRNHQLQVNTAIANALLGCLDKLTEMTESIGNGEGDQAECAELVKELQGFTGQPSDVPHLTIAAAESTPTYISQLTPDVANTLALATAQAPVFHGMFRITAECVMKFARAFMVTSVLEQAGEILHCYPGREDLEEEKFDREFEMFFHSTVPIEALSVSLTGIGEIEWFEVKEWSPSGNIAAEPSIAATAVTDSSAAPVSASAKTPAKATETKKSDTGQTVRVDVARLDQLMNLVGELVIDRTRISQIGSDLSVKYNDPIIEALDETVGHIARITSDLQDQIMKTRMMPIETVFSRFPRVVRDLAQKLGKDIKLDLVGGETELDRSVIEVIGDPLLHILRNSADHGLETPEQRIAAGKDAQGTITVSARHQENHIVIEIRDDGRGIDVNRIKAKAIESGITTKESADKLSDREALQFIFASGLSTATEVSEVSGRGVGMDIVRSNLQKLGGLIDLDTELGKGTIFCLRLPLTLAIIRGLLVKVSDVVYVLPLGSVIETLLVPTKTIQRVNKQEVIVIRGMTTPLIRLRDVLKTRGQTSNEDEEELFVVIVGMAEQRVGLVVDRLIGEQEVVIKSLSRYCGDIRGVSGATILGDGNVALIADVNGLTSKK